MICVLNCLYEQRKSVSCKNLPAMRNGMLAKFFNQKKVKMFRVNLNHFSESLPGISFFNPHIVLAQLIDGWIKVCDNVIFKDFKKFRREVIPK